ncbi:MAG: class I SAM-dependent methyltransferase [Gemmatimonadota bacterium]
MGDDSSPAPHAPFRPRTYWEDRLGAEYSLAGVGHTGLGRCYNGWMYRLRRRVFARLLRDLEVDAAGARVLDVGSGTGFYVQLWQAAGVARIEGIDVTATAVERLRGRFPEATFHRGDIGATEEIEGLDGRFDIVSAMDVLFHIVDDEAFERAIARIQRCLREGGWLIFSDNFLHGPERRLPHIVHRRLEHVRGVLEDVGFQVIERRPMFVVMTAPVACGSPLARRASRAIPWLAGRGEWAGWLLGAILYPLELALTSWKRESPTTEVMVCRKRGRANDMASVRP